MHGNMNIKYYVLSIKYHYIFRIRNFLTGNASDTFPTFLWRGANMEIGGILIGNLLVELRKEELETNHTPLTLIL
jgi:hypothetical protein